MRLRIQLGDPTEGGFVLNVHLPPELAVRIEPKIYALAKEILEAIGRPANRRDGS